MIINASNAQIINTDKVYIHDDILLLLEFDRLLRKLTLKFRKYNDNSCNYLITFINVIGFGMSSCDYWGRSECVLDFEYLEPSEQVIIPLLKTQWSKCSPNKTALYDEYIETIITFSSGDPLRVACEFIEIG